MASQTRAASNSPMLVGMVGGFGSRPWPSTACPGVTAKQLRKVRLGPQSYNANAIPKPIIPLGGTPLMQPLFQKAVTDCDVRDIAMALMYMPEDIKAHYGPNMARLRPGTGGSYYWEHQSETVNLNTAGCVVRGWLVDIEGKSSRPDTFIVLSADIRSNANIGKMMELHRAKNALISIALAPVPRREVYRFGTVFLAGTSIDGNGRQISGSAGEFARIVRFQEKDKNSKSNLNNASIYIMSERLLRLIADDIEVRENRNQLDPDIKERYLELKAKANNGRLTEAEERELKNINPYNLPVPGVDGVPNRKFDPERGNYLNDWTDPNTGKHYRLGIFSTILIRRDLLPENEANKNYQDWGSHIFPEVASHHPEIYESKQPGDPTGFFGYITRSLWADDGTRSAILQANMEMLMQEGGLVGPGMSQNDFSWWPKTHEWMDRDSNGRPIWKGKNVIIEEGAQIFGPTFLGDGTFVKRGSVIANSVIGAGWRIEGGQIINSALWPDRSTLGLAVLDPHLEYTLRNMHLDNVLVGSGFHRNGPRNALCFDDKGRYDVQLALGSQGLVTLENRVLVSNSFGSIVTSLDPSARETGISIRTPELEQLSAPAIREKIAPGIKRSAHILVVDDEPDELTLSLEELRKNGWQNISTASTQQEAEEMLGSTKFDFIVLDCILQTEIQVSSLEETDGVAVLKGQKDNPEAPNHHTPILIWSSYQSIVALKGLNPSKALMYGGLEVAWREKADKEIKEVGLSEVILRTILEGSF
ncbi:MAG: sugar phosphate nucleotidyltransferase [Candidatus Margulisiibacteriota bacterium]